MTNRIKKADALRFIRTSRPDLKLVLTNQEIKSLGVTDIEDMVAQNKVKINRDGKGGYKITRANLDIALDVHSEYNGER